MDGLVIVVHTITPYSSVMLLKVSLPKRSALSLVYKMPDEDDLLSKKQ